MITGFGLVGNGELLARVREDGLAAEAYYPSVGFFRHILQSHFGIHIPGEESQPGQCFWFAPPEFSTEQRYLEDTNVLRTTFRRAGLRAQLYDFAHSDEAVFCRTLEVENTGSEPLVCDLFHTEASSVADHRGEFGYNVAYYNRLGEHVVRYRGHPWNNAVESQVVWLIGGSPRPDTYQCGVSYHEEGGLLDAFLDVRDGALNENRYAFGDPDGTTSALMWRRTIQPGETISVSVQFAAGMSLFEAEDTLALTRQRQPEQHLSGAVSYWRGWIEKGKQDQPGLRDARLERLYLRSLLLLKLLQDRKFGALIAAPTLDPDYRYCWPRDGVYLAWALDLCGYHDEARHYYHWCRRTQRGEGLWSQNHYTDGRRHWAGIQVDQVGTVIWGAWQHFQLTRDRSFLVEMWPTMRRAADYLIARTDPETRLVYSEQDLWEETGGFLTYTQAASVAGLEAAADWAHEIGRETHAARWRTAARELRAEIERQLVQGGIYIGERDPGQKFAQRADYYLDISNL
ncbi:MAG: hypothetical protein FJX77_02675, partial [Armatimonadetes bacterium]|nr:hypothetical protein [Armatimonadota bacterium]